MAAALANGLVITMFMLLIGSDRQPVPDWGSIINLSTLLALLANVFRATISYIVTSIVSQAKWQWIGSSNSHNLAHFQAYDSSMRGSLGAAKIMALAARTSIPTLISTIILLVSFTGELFTQQSIRAVSCPQQASGPADVPLAHFVPRIGRFIHGQRAWIEDGSDAEVELMLHYSITSPDDASNKIRHSCSTGNCTFPDGDPTSGSHNSSSFSTIAVCHRSHDITDLGLSTVHDGNWSLILPNGQEIWPRPIVGGLDVKTNSTVNGRYAKAIDVTTNSNLTWMGSSLDPEMLQLSTLTLANITTVTMTEEGCTGPNSKNSQVCPLMGVPNFDGKERPTNIGAALCSSCTCFRTYTLDIQNNELLETVVETLPTFPATLDYHADPLALQRDFSYLKKKNFSLRASTSTPNGGCQKSLPLGRFSLYGHEHVICCRWDEAIYLQTRRELLHTSEHHRFRALFMSKTTDLCNKYGALFYEKFRG